MNANDLLPGSIATRAEEIEIDDVDPRAKDKDFWQRTEPLPWGTVRLTDFSERFSIMSLKANALGFSFFVLSITGYLMMIFGEVHFYSCLDIAARKYNEHGNKNHDDDGSWTEEYTDLHSFAFAGALLMLMVLPFAVQSSALMAENAVVPMLVVDTLQAHVTNFTMELDQFLTMLAVNKGSLSSGVVLDHLESTLTPTSLGQSRGGSGRLKREFAQDLLKHKVAMTRDVALSWRIGKFIKEIEHDCEVINTSVGLMVLNFICHLIPLNIFVFDEESCVPMWVVFFSLAQALSLVSIVKGGVECNEMINEGIDSLLHNWQLKFNMIAWSGGFLQPGDDDEVIGFVSKDPPGETQAKIQEEEEKEGNTDFGSRVRDAQRSRIDSIVRVLAHYEAESLTPFQVLGVTITKDMLTLVIGFFGGSIVGLVTHVLDEREQMRAVFMCHGLDYEG